MTATIIGHIRQRQRLQQLFNSGRLASTILLAGTSGIGKRLVARELFRSLFCEAAKPDNAATEPLAAGNYGGCDPHSDQRCHSCHLFDIGNLPDFYPIECADKEAANIESIRKLLFSLNLKAFGGGARAVLFNDADLLSAAVANALLKALEEPRPDTYYCLVCSNPSRLPPTLLSRCQTWFFDALSTTEISQILELKPELLESVKSDLPVAELAYLADGSMESLSSLAENSSLWRELETTLGTIFTGAGETALQLAQSMAKDREGIAIKLKLLRIMVRRNLRSDCTPESRTRWAVCLNNLIAAERLIFERHLGIGQVMGNLFLALSASATDGAFNRLPNSAVLLENFTL